ncbi:MAG: glutamate synthase large subunit [Anaerolineales bacterium]|nr:glutamate synthase large subunit [Anaerolineales bacterium]
MLSSASPYAPRFERGGCGIGFVADQYGRASHGLLRLALDSLTNMQHRGALAADARTGDGAGLLTPLPLAFFAREAERLTGRTMDPRQLGVGVFMLPPEGEAELLSMAEAALVRHDVRLLAWRMVPVDAEVLGARARATLPRLWHALIAPAAETAAGLPFEHRLYLARKDFERGARPLGAYVASMSSRTIVYKGLLLAPQMAAFYKDLSDPLYEVPLAVFHQRYSTNTTPTWQRAQPFRLLCHNGEINTLQGNLAWMKSREPRLSAAFCANGAALRPVVDTDGSDSAMLDNAVELLVHGGRDIRHALTMLVPPAWEKQSRYSAEVKDFFAYHASLSEPWDGPAGLVFTDGSTVGATLDRNGLRPCRYLITEDGLVAAASEAGAVPIEPERIRVQGRLGPGQMLAVDTQRGLIQEDEQIKQHLARQQPYGAWLKGTRRLPASPLAPLPDAIEPLTEETPSPAPTALQAAFGYTSEELVMVIRPMVENQAEAIGAMGDDTSPAVLSDKPRSLFSFFRQRFAEVTNPPIDPLRENLVMSLRVRLGARGNFLAETPAQAQLLELDSPLLSDAGLAALRADALLKPVTLSTLYPAAEGAAGLERALARLQAAAEAAARGGAETIILSDRGVDAAHTFIPAVLALSAVHHHLLRTDQRVGVDLVVESGEPREVHHFAVLIGYSAAAVNPYLALATGIDVARGEAGPATAVSRFLHAAEHGLLKIMSKMGISTVDAYCGAQIFEIVGLRTAVVEQYFTGTTCHLEGLTLARIAEIGLRWHAAAFGTSQPALTSPGFYKFKRAGEVHGYAPAIVHALHEAVRMPDALNGRWHEGFAAFTRYSRLQHASPPVDLSDLLEINPPGDAIPLAAVESMHAILWRFSTAAMSHGALSAEAHSTLAVAMNRLDAQSNSGEGGEDPARYDTDQNDRIKQVASARFGVTPAYLVSADELQIKMAQGSKPGEGGQLPGHKVTAEIAALRHATPGVTLISPPPHHDIYSIEDLAQLIYDLRQINPRAVISVKLVAQSGVGTIAAGVAKAGADVILISGSSGGTGASPLSSIKYAGIPWELGLAEAQYVLSESGLRGRVRLRVDGGLRTGRDVVIAALMGADEYSFGTAAVVAEGCVMARACHLNTCPTGIATQRPDLRAKFDGTPEMVMAFMLYVAQEVRETLAKLGLSSLEKAIGRVELLQQVRGLDDVDLTRLLTPPPPGYARRHLGDPNRVPTASPLNEKLWLSGVLLGPGAACRLDYEIANRDRTFGARLSGEVARRHGDAGLGRANLDVRLSGSAGQSFGAFGVPGLNLTLSGEANDYVGKGLAGGRIVIHPRPNSRLRGKLHPAAGEAAAPVLAGNTVLYGATGGTVFIAGRAGERFAVRNSGAIAVVEGVGDHGCEYMTGGLVIVLGPFGQNFAAGMSSGIAYLLDSAAANVNTQLVRVEPLDADDEACLRGWLTQHHALTGSPRAAALLADWAAAAAQFVRVVPKEGALPPRPIPVDLSEAALALA